MRRTANRPLPSGKLMPWEALTFGVTLTVLAEIYLSVFVNPLTGLLGLTVIAGYLFAYTPLKTRTSLSTMVGAFPGAVPPLIGWAAARGDIGLQAWVLFAILFLWQFPHFLAIAWMYREDYGRAGILMLPVVEPDGRVTGQQIVVYTLMLLPVSLLPTALGIVRQDLSLRGNRSRFAFSLQQCARSVFQIQTRGPAAFAGFGYLSAALVHFDGH